MPPSNSNPRQVKDGGVFATRDLDAEALILNEKPLFISHKPGSEFTSEDAIMAFRQLTASQKREFLRLCNDGEGPFAGMKEVFNGNSFSIPDFENPTNPSSYGLFPLQARFNHSCIPNAYTETSPDGKSVSCFAGKKIKGGEEIQICYFPCFIGWTREERIEALGFSCDCMACELGTPHQHLSDIRRQLIRGLRYLTTGGDHDELGQLIQQAGSRSSVVIEPQLKLASENFSIPLTSRFIYDLLRIFLIEEEGLLNGFVLDIMINNPVLTASRFKSGSNAIIAHKVLQQKT